MVGFFVFVASGMALGQSGAPMVSYQLDQAVADKYGAKCLGGQAPSYELRRNPSSDKVGAFLCAKLGEEIWMGDFLPA
jgi:hypothetical protein